VADEREHLLLRAVLKRATVDRPFRRALLTDPHRAIDQAFGIKIPAQYRVRFVERDPDVDALIVLPDFDARAADGGDEELSDDELEHVAGGRDMEYLTWADE
jgi:hypothetical protein